MERIGVILSRFFLDDRKKTESIVQELLNVNPGWIIRQKDTFFEAREGLLKINEVFHIGDAFSKDSLIHYYKIDKSRNRKTKMAFLTDTGSLKNVLEKTNGKLGVVEIDRTLYLYDINRISFDSVKGLGEYLEIKVKIKDNETESECWERMKVIIAKLELPKENLRKGTYLDMLKTKTRNDSTDC